MWVFIKKCLKYFRFGLEEVKNHLILFGVEIGQIIHQLILLFRREIVEEFDDVIVLIEETEIGSDIGHVLSLGVIVDLQVPALELSRSEVLFGQLCRLNVIVDYMNTSFN